LFFFHDPAADLPVGFDHDKIDGRVGFLARLGSNARTSSKNLGERVIFLGFILAGLPAPQSSISRVIVYRFMGLERTLEVSGLSYQEAN